MTKLVINTTREGDPSDKQAARLTVELCNGGAVFITQGRVKGDPYAGSSIYVYQDQIAALIAALATCNVA